VVSRRTIITLPLAVAISGLAAGTALATSFDRGAGLGPVPRTLAHRRPIVGGRLRTEPVQRMTHLAISWSGAQATIATRNGGVWTSWAQPEACAGGPDGTPTGGHLFLVAGDVTEYEVTLSGEAATGFATEINTVDGPALAVAAEPLGAMPLPDGTSCPITYLSRAAWGADEELRFTGGTEVWPAEYAPTQALTVHHTAGANNDPDPAGTVRAIYYYQCITQAWGDVGYHLFIDEQGRVYEGRWSGPDDIPLFNGAAPAGTDPGLVVAGHIGGYNTGNLGVCLLGNLTSQGPTPAARATLVTVLAHMARVTGVDPQAVVNYLGPTGNTRTVLGISGHRDWAATECPGNTFYPSLPDIRSEVAAQLAVAPTPTPSGSTAPTPTASASPSPSVTATPTPTRTKRRGPKP
jgi:N-acetylmuramoyl-L-alanine amidase